MMSVVNRDAFKLKLDAFIKKSKSSNTFLFRFFKYYELVTDVKVSQCKIRQGKPLTMLDYRRIQSYDILTIGDVGKLIKNDLQMRME